MEAITPGPSLIPDFLNGISLDQRIIDKAEIENIAYELEVAALHLYASGLKLQNALDQASGLALPAEWHQKLLQGIDGSVALAKRLPSVGSNAADSGGNLKEMNAWQRELQRCL